MIVGVTVILFNVIELHVSYTFVFYNIRAVFITVVMLREAFITL